MNTFDGLLEGSFKDLDHVTGFKQTMRAIENDRAKVVYLAKDCDPRLFDKLSELADESDVELILVDTMVLLGEMAGLKVESAAACILK